MNFDSAFANGSPPGEAAAARDVHKTPSGQSNQSGFGAEFWLRFLVSYPDQLSYIVQQSLAPHTPDSLEFVFNHSPGPSLHHRPYFQRDRSWIGLPATL